MSANFQIRDQEAVHFCNIHYDPLAPLKRDKYFFIRPVYRDIFLESIRFFQKNKGLELYAYCMMSSHVHMIVARHGKQNMEAVIRDIKKYLSRFSGSTKLIEAIRDNAQYVY